MNALRTFFFFVVAVSTSFAADSPINPVVSSFYEKPYDIITSTRTNGCKLELRRYPEAYTKTRPQLQGFWVQDVFVGTKLVLKIRHSSAEKEQSLAIENDCGYGVVQIDRSLIGAYGTFIVTSLKDQKLTDVLVLTPDGSLRHSTTEEFVAWQRRGEINKHAIEAADRAIKDAAQNTNDKLNK